MCDGQAYNWTIHKTHFKNFTAIADFMHVVCYLYVTAWAAGGTAEEQWSRYLAWLRSCWQGRVAEVIGEVEGWQQRRGNRRKGGTGGERPAAVGGGDLELPAEQPGADGLPALPPDGAAGDEQSGGVAGRGVQRPTQKPAGCWDRLAGDGGEAMLQLRAAVLSEDDRLARHFAQRPGNPYRRRYPAKKLANVS